MYLIVMIIRRAQYTTHGMLVAQGPHFFSELACHCSIEADSAELAGLTQVHQ